MVDACSLAPVLSRNLLLSLAEAEFFRVRWSQLILDETERAIAKIMRERAIVDCEQRAARARKAMEDAFEDASVSGYESLVGNIENLPDPNDAHVIAAAIKTRASIIVTENMKHFPVRVLAPLDLEAKTADEFIADTIGLHIGRAVAAIKDMRLRFQRPEKTPEALLLDMEAAGLTQTVDLLRENVFSL